MTCSVMNLRSWVPTPIRSNMGVHSPPVMFRTKEMHNKQQLTLRVLVTTIDAQWEGMGDVGSARYEPALLPPCPTIRVLSYGNE